jgi:hypothetical protein
VAALDRLPPAMQDQAARRLTDRACDRVIADAAAARHADWPSSAMDGGGY